MNIDEVLAEHEAWFKSKGTEGKRADFTNENLDGIRLRGAFLPFAIFKKSTIVSAKLSNADLRSCSFEGANLYGIDLKGATLSSASFFKAYGANADFRNATIERGDFRKANLPAALFGEANLAESKFNSAFLRSTNFSKAYLNKSNFDGANLELARFDGAYIQGVNFIDANVAGANFKDAEGVVSKKPNENDKFQSLRYEKLMLLGLDDSSSAEDILAAWKKQAFKFHPDRAPAGSRVQAAEKFLVITEARDWLIKDMDARMRRSR
jgi:uncharacterized protein YjbI with pentapeptide repeats